jgi:hypothetical protein
MKVYLAAQYARRDELRAYRYILENHLGIEVTSRWLDEKEPLNSQMGQHPEYFYVETATFDLEDVDKADAVIFFSENPLVGVPRGGRHVEYGYAFKGGKTIFVVGPKENVFHYIGKVHHFDTFEDLAKQLLDFLELDKILAETNG